MGPVELVQGREDGGSIEEGTTAADQDAQAHGSPPGDAGARRIAGPMPAGKGVFLAALAPRQNLVPPAALP